jgi:hypothetical protein
MIKALFVAMTNVTGASQEADFNDWLDNVHLPGLRLMPGVTKATRYEFAAVPSAKFATANGFPSGESLGKYWNLYEVETDDLSAFTNDLLTYLERMDQRAAAEGSKEPPPFDVLHTVFYTQRGEPQVATDQTPQ